jgi:hypothetical protein
MINSAFLHMALTLISENTSSCMFCTLEMHFLVDLTCLQNSMRIGPKLHCDRRCKELRNNVSGSTQCIIDYLESEQHREILVVLLSFLVCFN